jgi:hypothetical protein
MEILREEGDWRCIEIPGFLIYTRLTDERSRAFADALRGFNVQLGALFAGTEHIRPMTNQIPVVLRLMPQPGEASDTPRGPPVQAYDDELSLLYLVRLPFAVPLMSAAPGPALPPKLPTSTTFPLPQRRGELVVTDPVTEAEYLARDAFARRLKYARPKPPEWLLHGLERVMQEMRVAGGRLVLMPQPRSRLESEPVPIAELFAADFSHDDMLRHEALTRQSALLLRWAFFAEPERCGALWTFAALSARGPVREPVFESAFSMSYGELDVVLTDPRLWRGTLDTFAPAEQTPLSQEPRAANEEELARLFRTIEGLNERATTHNAAMASAR